MGVSSSNPTPPRAIVAPTASGQPSFFGIALRKILYLASLVLFACAGFFSAAATAQEERPQIIPADRKAAKKKDSSPRALAVLQMSANGKASLVPVAILVNGKFFDATAYKADPIPMALESGNVYEGERTGSSLGLFTVGGALHSNAVNAQAPWIGTGVWRPHGAEPVDKELKAESTPAGIGAADGPPRLTKNPNAAKETTPANSAPASTTTPAPSSAPSGDEPPRLIRPATPSPSSDAPASGDSKSPDAKPSDAKPADAKSPDSKATDAKADNRPNLPASDSGSVNHPRLRRGAPAEALPEDDFPGYSKPGAAHAASTGKSADAPAAKPPVDMVPAISDATGPDPRPFVFEWLKSEVDERHQQMTELATDQVRQYLDAQAKAKITPKPAAQKTTHTVKKNVHPILENVKMNAYDLWLNNQPVVVISADAHLPPPPAGAPQSAVETEMQYSVMIVAYPDIYGNWHKLYAGVTDKYHLDLTPKLDLIDAVDADGDGRGELLFRETNDNGSGWVIYRASADKLWKMFDSLHPE